MNLAGLMIRVLLMRIKSFWMDEYVKILLKSKRLQSIEVRF